jgi:hypothetical protein
MDKASLGFGAFSATVDLVDIVSQAYAAWRSLRDLDHDVRLLRAKLLLQKSHSASGNATGTAFTLPEGHCSADFACSKSRTKLSERL